MARADPVFGSALPRDMLGRMSNVLIETDHGTIELALDEEKAPKSVANFLAYVDAKHYDGTIFHRVIKNFMAQGGGYDASYDKRPVRDPVPNEADNGLKNTRGTVAMARTSDPHSATAQFFVNLVDNGFLDHTEKSSSGWGYTVFGKVVRGMDVVDKMAEVPTGSAGPFAKDAPQTPIVITSARRA
jgi:peptidyl-prolyl cis-trans isomerase B (cyclophilin B)